MDLSSCIMMSCIRRIVISVYLFHLVHTLPNIVFILTDDQDKLLGGMTPMSKTQKLIGNEGIVFQNMFATSPLCCPSRSSILTGKYVHNHQAINNSLSGNCSSQFWQETHEKDAFVSYLHRQGYRTFFAGKYLNEYGSRKAGGVKHVPPGWDEWHGLVGNSVYYNYSLSVNGKRVKHGDNYKDDYLTDVIGRAAEDFLVQKSIDNKQPFFMMLSTPACHAPFTSAPQYMSQFEDKSAPRGGSFNYAGKDKHWLLRTAKHPLSNESINYIDDAFRKRWRTLLSVDDLVERVVNLLTERSLISDTYIFFSSDNGFHLGQFSLPNDKRQLYDFDIRVPFMVRGPNIHKGQTRSDPVLTIDLAPTFLELAQVSDLPVMDGKSMASILQSTSSNEWGRHFLIEHTGEYVDKPECPYLNFQEVGECHPDCVCEDSKNNTYACTRSLTPNEDYIYCEFEDLDEYVEIYDMKKDPDQLINLLSSVNETQKLLLSERLSGMSSCKGKSCWHFQ